LRSSRAAVPPPFPTRRSSDLAAPDPAAAMTVVREAERELARVPSCEPCSMGYLTTAATATARAGQLPRARSFLAEAERISGMWRSEEHTSELQSRFDLVCRLL